MEEYRETGGAYIGNGRATFPFAKLVVNKYKLELNVGILGNLIFRRSDIVSIQPNTGLSRGVKIDHRVSKYKDKVFFLPVGSVAETMEQIAKTGFLVNSEAIPIEIEQYIVTRQLSGGFPLKISATIAIVGIWNIFFLYDMRKTFTTGVPNFGIGIKMALGFMLLICTLLLTNKRVQILILKPGQDISNLKIMLYFILIITIIMFVVFNFIPTHT